MTPDHQGWTNETHLLASTIDAVHRLFALTIAVNSEGGKYEPPAPIPRPGDAARIEAQRQADAVAKTALLSRVREIESIVLPKGDDPLG